MKIFLQLFMAHLKDMFRDKMVLFWFFLFPVLFVFLYGTIFSSTGNEKFRISLAAPEKSPTVAIFEKMPVFEITYLNQEQALNNIKQGKTDVAVIIQDNGANKEQVFVHYKNDQNSTGTIVAGLIRQVLTEVELANSGLPRHYQIIERPEDEESLRMIDYILPGILGMAIMQLGLFGSMQFVTYREKRIIKRLALAPISKVSFLSSEIFLRLLMSLVQGLLILSIGNLVYKVPIKGSPIAIVGIILLGSSVFISLGYLICSFAKTTEAANGLVQAVQFPMMFLSGIFFPLSFLPASMLPVVKVMPLTYLGDSLRQIILGLSGEFNLLTGIIFLIGWLIITLFLAVRFFRWE